MTEQQTKALLLSLPARQCACLILSRRDHLNTAQIADVLCIGIHDVRDALAAGIVALADASKKTNTGECTCRK